MLRGTPATGLPCWHDGCGAEQLLSVVALSGCVILTTLSSQSVNSHPVQSGRVSSS